MKYECKITDGIMQVTFPPQLTFIVCDEVEDDIFASAEQADKIIFNLEEVEYISSEFVKVCAKMLKKYGREKFQVMNIGGFPEFVFQTSGLKRLLFCE